MHKQVGLLLLTMTLVGASIACHSTNTPTQSDQTNHQHDAGMTKPTAPDGGAACSAGVCNYQTQAGCSAGLMCHPQLDADQRVIPTCLAAGTAAAGDSCTWLGCEPGYICMGDGHCRHMCCGGDWSVCASDESCTGAIELLPDGSSVPVAAGVGVCAPTDDCDVFDANTCPSGRSCSIVDSRGGVNCLPTGTAKAYEICSPTELCQPGLICVRSSNGIGQCRRLCRSSGGSPSCPESEGTVCKRFSNDPVGVGECVYPTD
jgi:hypothetical protein